MSYAISTLKTDLQSMLHNTSLNKIQDVNGLINRGARTVIQDIDPSETIRISQISGQLFDDVYDYSAPADLKGSKVIDIRPQVNRGQNDNFSRQWSERFDLKKEIENNKFSIRYNTGTKSYRIKKKLTSGKVLNDFNDITSNGTWAVGNDADNLAQDKVNKVSGNASLRFDLDGSTTDGYLENSTFAAVDLSEEENISSLFLWVYIPDPSTMTSVNLRWGDDSSNYWADTVTSTHEGLSFLTGWNLLRFDWEGASETGTPTASSVNYARVTVNYDGTATQNFRCDNLIVRVGQIWENEYYSKFLFSNSSGTFQETVTDDSDVANLDTDSYNILLIKCAELAAHQQQAENSSFDISIFKTDYIKAVRKYNLNNPSQAIKGKSNYY